MEYIDFSFQTGVCIGARLCVQETGELNLWRFMHWSKQFFCLIMVHSRLFFFRRDLVSFLLTEWQTLWGMEGTGDKNYNFAVYYFQITAVCNYVANILTCAVKLLRTLTAHLWSCFHSLSLKWKMTGSSMQPPLKRTFYHCVCRYRATIMGFKQHHLTCSKAADELKFNNQSTYIYQNSTAL